MLPFPQLRPSLAVPLALALLHFVPPAAAQGTAALELLVREADTARPLADATVRIVSTGQVAVTDPTGHAMLLQVPAGRHAVEVRHFGHAPRTVQLDFSDGMVTQLQIALDIRPVELEGVDVTTEAQVARLRDAGFYHRERLYPADFLHPEDVAEARAQGTPLSNLMRGRLGITVQRAEVGGYTLVSSRTAGMRPCPVAIFVDGVRQYWVTDIDRVISMMAIEAIEIYGGRLGTPLQFEVPGHCGAVVIWTPYGR